MDSLPPPTFIVPLFFASNRSLAPSIRKPVRSHVYTRSSFKGSRQRLLVNVNGPTFAPPHHSFHIVAAQKRGTRGQRSGTSGKSNKDEYGIDTTDISTFFSCPRCAASIMLREEEVPNRGIWLTCYACTKKFFAKKNRLEDIRALYGGSFAFPIGKLAGTNDKVDAEEEGLDWYDKEPTAFDDENDFEEDDDSDEDQLDGEEVDENDENETIRARQQPPPEARLPSDVNPEWYAIWHKLAASIGGEQGEEKEEGEEREEGEEKEEEEEQ